ncbi:hypothetical protein CC86DRAFT_377924 [Ophiobolus disseminans]|uniref:Uncharacterized protein n=1 Tax=Ophiobolus disseminans TaxID=1469910 RepID=A0A6A7ACL4_9PLEO|nr:hypothetical protein CC86DRAFT_377924 [Ophiobolus disseminans]
MAPSEPTPQPMLLANILSDLVTLGTCPPAAALALVSASSSSSPSQLQTSPSTQTAHNASTSASAANDDDIDLTRAKELLKLHYEVKQAHQEGRLRVGLEGARRDVAGVVGGGMGIR